MKLPSQHPLYVLVSLLCLLLPALLLASEVPFLAGRVNYMETFCPPQP